MENIIWGIIAGVGTALLTSSIFALIRRIRIRTRCDEAIEDIRHVVDELSAGQHLLFKLILPILVKMRDGQNNGELREALRLYNEYMQNK